MAADSSGTSRAVVVGKVVSGVVTCAAILGIGLYGGFLAARQGSGGGGGGEHGGEEGHEGEAHAEEGAPKLSAQTLSNLGVEFGELAPREFVRTREVAAVVEARPDAKAPVHAPVAGRVVRTLVWGVDLAGRYSTEIPQWYAGQCPLVESNRVIVGTGGDALMVALDLATGTEIWRTPNAHDWKMTHASIAVQDVGGRHTYVYCGNGGVAGVDAVLRFGKTVSEEAHAVGGDVGAQALAVVAAVEVAALRQAGGIGVDMFGGGIELFGFVEAARF